MRPTPKARQIRPRSSVADCLLYGKRAGGLCSVAVYYGQSVSAAAAHCRISQRYFSSRDGWNDGAGRRRLLPGAFARRGSGLPMRKPCWSMPGLFAAQAMEQKRLLDFPFFLSITAGANPSTHGLAQPIVTTETAAVCWQCVAVFFPPAEVSAFSVLGNMAPSSRWKIPSCAAFTQGKGRNLINLLEISAELGAIRQLESFLPRFVVRAADFLGFSRAFVALVDQGGCRLRWGANKGTPNRLEIDISAVAKRAIDSRSPHICDDINQLPRMRRCSCGAGNLI